MKLVLRIQNTIPLFMVILILNTGWKLAWQRLATSPTLWLQKLAGAALQQTG